MRPVWRFALYRLIGLRKGVFRVFYEGFITSYTDFKRGFVGSGLGVRGVEFRGKVVAKAAWNALNHRVAFKGTLSRNPLKEP